MDRQTADYIGALLLTTVDLPTLVYLAPPSFKAPSSGFFEVRDGEGRI